MKHTEELSRRQFMRTGAFGAAMLAASAGPSTARAAVTKTARDPYDGLKMGMTTYTLRAFSLDQALAMIKQAGVRYVSLKDMHLPMKSTAEERREAGRKVADARLVLTGCGVVYLKNNEAEIKSAFDYARDAGMPTITCSPDLDALDTTEKFAKEYDIRIAIHNHGPGDKKYPSPLDVWNLVRDRDAHMGVCMDVGHTVRIGVDPMDAIEQCAPRLYDFHMKDVNEATAKGHPVPVGAGVIDIVGVLKTLVKIKYAYTVGLEYEADEKAPMPGILESYAYMRGILATLS